MAEVLLKIVPVSWESIPLIRELTSKVWPQTYRGILSDGQIDYMLDMMYSEKSLKKQMEDGVQFVIIYDNSTPAGFTAYQKLSEQVFKLHKIYVLPDQQKKGIGKFAIDFVLNEVEKEGGTALHLQVNRNNVAKSFYEKLGFRSIEEIKLDIGNGYVMDDYIMEKLISDK